MKNKENAINLLTMTDEEVEAFVIAQPSNSVYRALYKVIQHYRTESMKLLIEIDRLKKEIKSYG